MKVYNLCKKCRFHKLAEETVGCNCGYVYPDHHDVDNEGCPMYEKESGQDTKTIEEYKKAIQEENNDHPISDSLW